MSMVTNVSGIMSFINSILRILWASLNGAQVTIEYPFVARQSVTRAHGRLHNNFAECTGCLQCASSCPMNAIEILSRDFLDDALRPTTAKSIMFERKIEHFRIDYRSCILCGECVHCCPTNSLGYEPDYLECENQPQNLIVDLAMEKRTRLLIKNVQGRKLW